MLVGPSQAKINCKDNGDGSADVDYLPTVPGNVLIYRESLLSFSSFHFFMSTKMRSHLYNILSKKQILLT